MNLEHIYYAGFAFGGLWTGYLLGQFSFLKEMNRRLTAVLDDLDAALDARDYWFDQYHEAQAEMDRMAELIGKHQEKAHACAKCNQFASKRAAKTAELAAYVASQA